MAELTLSDGDRSYDFSAGGNVRLREEGLDLPPAALNDTYVETPDTEGRRRARTRPANVEGSFSVVIQATTAAAFYDAIDELQEIVASAHREKGTLTYTPPNGTQVTYDLEAITVSDLPQRGYLLGRQHAEATVSFEARPYGRLAAVTLGGYLDVAEGLGPEILLALDATNGLTDLSGNGYTTTATGVTVGGYSPGPLSVGDDGGTDLSGSQQAVTNYQPFVTDAVLTITGWAYQDTATGQDALFGGAGTNGPCLLINSPTAPTNLIWAPAVGSSSYTFTADWPGTGQWVHWALVSDQAANTATLYIDGALTEHKTGVTVNHAATAGDFEVGHGYAVSALDGKVMGVAVYERALTADEIADLYAAGSGAWTLDGPVDDFPIAGVSGQVPALGSLVLTEPESEDRAHVEVGVQHDFDPANPEPISLAAVTDITALSGTSNTRSGSVSTNILRAALSTSAVALATAEDQPHAGLWKVRARVYADSPGVRVRLAWRAGSGAFVRERWRLVPGEDGWYDVDLGTVDITRQPTGHTAEFRLEGLAESGIPVIDLDTLTLIPADGYIRLRGSTTEDTPTSTAVAAEDFSTHTGGSLLNGTTPLLAPSGTWGGGAVYYTAGEQAYAEDSYSGTIGNEGNHALLGSGTLTTTAITAKVTLGGAPFVPGALSGVTARYVDANNFLLAGFYGDGGEVRLYKNVSSTFTLMGYANCTGDIYLYMSVGPDGTVAVLTSPDGEAWTWRILTLADSNLATGGALQGGKYGLYHHVFFDSMYAYYDDIRVTGSAVSAAGITRPAINADQGLTLTHEAAYTENAAGTGVSMTPIREGHYLTLPPATRAERVSRIVVRARRDDIDNGQPDTGTADTLTAALTYTPRVTLLGA